MCVYPEMKLLIPLENAFENMLLPLILLTADVRLRSL